MMPKIYVKQSIRINVATDNVRNVITNLTDWAKWSPWLILEPGVKVTVRPDGKSFSWEGNLIGSGEMSLNSLNNQNIDFDLLFLKPFKSKAKAGFELKAEDDSTIVSWIMDSSLPFFMFWMVKKMESMIAKDYERGLAMLKDFIESGEVNSKLDFSGVEKYPGCTYIGIKTSCKEDELKESMTQDFQRLREYITSGSLQTIETPFSIIHKMDFITNQTIYSIGIPVKNVPTNLPSGFSSGKIPGTRIYALNHTGAYKHLGNPWSAGYMLARNKKFKLNKEIDPFEIYVSDSTKTQEKDLITKVCFPIK